MNLYRAGRLQECISYEARESWRDRIQARLWRAESAMNLNLDMPCLCSDASGSGSEYIEVDHSESRSGPDLESDLESDVDRKRKRPKLGKSARLSESGKAKHTPKRRESKQGLETPPVICFFLRHVEQG